MLLLYLFLIYLFIIILLFLLLLFSYKSFLYKYKDLASKDYTFTLYKIKDYGAYAYIVFNFAERKFYFSRTYFDLYRPLLNYYLKLFGFENLIKFLVNEDELDKFKVSSSIYFSVLFNHIDDFIEENFTNKVYRLNLLFSLLLFLSIFFLLRYYFIEFLTQELYINSLILRYSLLLIIILHFFFNYFTITSKSIKDEDEEDYTSKHLFIKLLVLLLKLINSLPILFNNFFNIFINLILFYLIFNYCNLLHLAYFTLAIYAIFLLTFKILYEISNYLLNKNFNNKIITFLTSFKLSTILLLPSGTIILLIWYKILWWLFFFYKAWEEKKLKFFFEIAYLYIFYKRIDAANRVQSYINDEELLNFFSIIYYFTWSSFSLKEYVGKEEFNKGLDYIRERKKNKEIILKYIDLDLALSFIKDKDNKIVW